MGETEKNDRTESRIREDATAHTLLPNNLIEILTGNKSTSMDFVKHDSNWNLHDPMNPHADEQIKTYDTVQIGNQTWFKKNLDTAYFRNGDAIPHAKTDKEWLRASENEQPAWCYYDNDEANGRKYGKLYNWHTVNDPRGLAPKGWHMPSEEEYKILQTTVNDKVVKLIGISQTMKNGLTPTNETGFTALFAGRRNGYGTFGNLGNYTYFWSSTESGSTAHLISLSTSDSGIHFNRYRKGYGFSIRCFKD